MKRLESLGSDAVRQSQQHFGIRTDRDRAHGISTPQLKALARRLGHSHELAGELWKTGVLEVSNSRRVHRRAGQGDSRPDGPLGAGV